MKKYLLLLAMGALAFDLMFAQPVNWTEPRVERQTANQARVQTRFDPITGQPLDSLPQFSLDFSGGTPKDLVKAIAEATDKPLNTVIPDEAAELKIPAFSVKNVTVAQLFSILERASTKTAHYWFLHVDSNSGYLDFTDSYGFRTDGVPNENSIWYFHWDKKSTPQEVIAPTVCQFYQLGPYLEAGYTVDDITTAIKTGWKMLGDTRPPEISYHKETRVLIAVGEKHKASMIGEVLKQLPTDKAKVKPVETRQ